MKILLVHQYYLGENDPGGSRFNQFVSYWSQKGYEITVVAGTVHYTTGEKAGHYRGRFITKEFPSANVTVLRCFVSDGYNKSFLGRLWAYFSFTFSSLWACLFHIDKHDVLIVTSPPLFVGVTGIITSWVKRIPLVFEVRDLWPESAIDTGVLKNPLLIKASYLVEKLCYRKASKINVLTPAFKEVLIRKKNVPANKIIEITNGADLDIFQPGPKDNWVRKQYGLNGKFVITYMGAHGVANHLLSLIKVAERCQEFPDIIFLLIGDGMEKSMLQAYVRDKGLQNIIFIDSQPKSTIPDYCQASDICTAVLKKVDTFKTVYPNKVFDYMSCARPILLGIDGAARKLVEEANCGYYVDPDKPEEFKKKILELYANREHIEELGRNGYEFVKQHFSRESLSNQYEAELLQITSKGCDNHVGQAI